jgi:hypothetical protein
MKEGTFVPSRNYRIERKSNVKKKEMQSSAVQNSRYWEFLQEYVNKLHHFRKKEAKSAFKKQKIHVSMNFVEIR